MTRCYSVVAKVGLALVATALVLDCVALGLDIVLGRMIVNGIEVTAESLETSSSLSSAANLAIPSAVLIGGGAFLWWFHCAYRRLATTIVPTTFQPIWAVAAWVVPGLNLIRPPRIMAELTARPRLTVAWWLLWLGGGAVQVGLRFISPTSQQGWVNWQSTALVANLVLLASLGCGVLLISMARRRPLVGPPSLVRPDPALDRSP